MNTLEIVLVLFGPMLFGLLALWVCEWARRRRLAARLKREARQRAEERARVGTEAAPRVPRPRWPYEPTLPRRGHVPPRPIPAPAPTPAARRAVESSPLPDPFLPHFRLDDVAPSAPVFRSGGGGDFGGGGASGSWESSSSDSSSSSSSDSSSSSSSE